MVERVDSEKKKILEGFRLRRLELEIKGVAITDLRFRGIVALVDVACIEATDVIAMNRAVDHAKVLGERIAREKAERRPSQFVDLRVGSDIFHR